MKLRYPFDPMKSLEAMCYIVDRLGVVEKVKLTKLMYLAERDHLISHGRPLTGDVLKAMKYGPVPSGAMDILDWGPVMKLPVEDHLQIVGYSMSLKRRMDHSRLGPSEREVLQRVIHDHGGKGQWQLVNETHEYPEYKAVWQGEGAELIPYELILEQYAAPQNRVWGRPVIPATALPHMSNPFDDAETDL